MSSRASTTSAPTMFVSAAEIMNDWGISRAKAYGIIRQLNESLRRQYPKALIVRGKVNRKWYEEACLIRPKEEEE